jgi:hypothetical protein
VKCIILVSGLLSAAHTDLDQYSTTPSNRRESAVDAVPSGSKPSNPSRNAAKETSCATGSFVNKGLGTLYCWQMEEDVAYRTYLGFR